MDVLSIVYDDERGLFPRTIRLVDGRYVSSFDGDADVLRYSITCLLGIKAARDRGVHHSLTDDVGVVIERFMRRYANAVSRPADIGLLLVLMSACGADHAGARACLSRIRDLNRVRDPRSTIQDLSWMLWGAARAARASVIGANQVASSIFERIVTDYVIEPSGLPEHRPVRWRSGIVSFGAVSYYLRALAEYLRDTADPDAKKIYGHALASTLRTQRPDGAWPWLLSAKRGTVLQVYPIYSVHQLGMAPLFLTAAIEMKALNDREPIERGISWLLRGQLAGHPMFELSPFFMYRALERRDVWPRLQRFARATRASSGEASDDNGIPRLRINRVSHSYEWGWLLFADNDRVRIDELAGVGGRAEAAIGNRGGVVA